MGSRNVISPHRGILLVFGLIAILLFQSTPVRGNPEEDAQEEKESLELFRQFWSKSGSPLEPRQDGAMNRELGRRCSRLGAATGATRKRYLQELAEEASITLEQVGKIMGACCKSGAGCTVDELREISRDVGAGGNPGGISKDYWDPPTEDTRDPWGVGGGTGGKSPRDQRDIVGGGNMITGSKVPVVLGFLLMVWIPCLLFF